nr:MerR family transcriptional regulator [Desulforamulus hydrothermalis]
MGEIAELAGVSRRTIDYYTNLGLLKPLRSESHYRYYTKDTLWRLKIIEGMKKQRYTLEEIKQTLDNWDNGKLLPESRYQTAVNINFLKEQFSMLEGQLAQLQPLVNSKDVNQAALITKQVVMQSMAVIQSLIIYFNETVPFV